MNAHALIALGPLIVLAATAVVTMLAAAFHRGHTAPLVLTLAGLAGAGIALAFAWPLAPSHVAKLLLIDSYALFYTGLILAAAAAVALFAHPYLEKKGGKEYYVLLTSATLGAAVLASSIHFASFFLGLELLSVSLYALIAYPRGNLMSTEAGVKYLVLAGASSAFLLFGMGLVYAATGALDLAAMTSPLTDGGSMLPLIGVAMIIVGIGFKLSLVPFHGWAPDVYQGAPAPTAAFVATVSKGAVFAVLLRCFAAWTGQWQSALFAVLAPIAVLSMFVGNWLALRQENIKRLLAYSSIAHMGYLLVALLAGGAWGPAAVTIYLTAYFISTLGAFGIIAVLSPATRDADTIDDYRGLAWRRPWLAGILTIMLLSLAGIPLTAGFLGKFYVLGAGMKAGLWWLVITMVVNSVIGIFYYLRIIATVYQSPTGAVAPGGSPAPAAESQTTYIALAALVTMLLWLGLYPAPLIRWVQMIFAL